MLPEDIKKKRMALGLSQEDFAHLLGVSYASVNRWESGRAKPSRMAIGMINSPITLKKIKRFTEGLEKCNLNS